MDDIIALQPWLECLLVSVAPARRTQAMRRIAVELRKLNQARIRDQENPDGSNYEPRKHGKKAMFRKLRQRLTVRSSANSAATGFQGRNAVLARVHQFGQASPVVPHGRQYHYPVRALLGIPMEDVERIESMLVEMLTP